MFFVFFAKKCVEAVGEFTETLQFLSIQNGQGRNEITDKSGAGNIDSLLKRADEAGQPRVIVGKPGSVRGAFCEAHNTRGHFIPVGLLRFSMTWKTSRVELFVLLKLLLLSSIITCIIFNI